MLTHRRSRRSAPFLCSVFIACAGFASNGVSDEIEPDCDGDGIPDASAIANGLAPDCNRNGIPDACDLRAAGPLLRTAASLRPADPSDSVSRSAVADLDGNGLPDVLFALRSGVVKAFLSRPSRQFAESVVATFSEQLSNLALGDFDRDEILDFVVTSGSKFYFVRGIGNGAFADPIELAIPGRYPVTVAAGDFTGDGVLDLACGSSSDEVVSIWPGLGNGTFGAPLELSVGYQRFQWPVAADLNGDRVCDLAWKAPQSTQVVVALGRPGDVPRLYSYANPYQNSSSSYRLLVGDATGDGVSDLVLPDGDTASSGSPGFLLVFAGFGNGTFGLPSKMDFPRGVVHVAFADLDGDGDQDLVASLGDGVLSVLRGDGTGAFGPPVEYGGSRADVSVVDVDGDGLKDVVLNAGEILYQDSTGELIGPLVVRSEHAISRLAVGRLNDDPHPDWVAFGEWLTEFLGTGDGRGVAKGTAQLSGWHFMDSAFGDVNGDGYDDFLVLDRGTSFSGPSLYLSRGDGTFQFKSTIPAGDWSDALELLDADLDGNLDLAVNATYYAGSAIFLFLGNGDGTFRQASTSSAGTYNDLVVADFNGDGYPDLAALEGDRVHIMLNQGGKRFSSPGMVWPSTIQLQDITAADFDGDGNIDLIVLLRDTKELLLLRGKGNGMFRQPAKFPAPVPRAARVFACDLGGDGPVDLVVGQLGDQFSGNGIAIFRGNGDGTFEAPLEIPTPGFPASFACSDMNGDGVFDLLAAIGQSTWVFPGGPGPHSQDFDRDGIPDECEPETGCRVPGDINEDVILDISDAVALLGYLFLGEPERLPCGNGGVGDPGNLALLDWQRDGAIDITDAVLILRFLYLGGPAHPLAVPGLEMTACVEIPGCARG